MNQDLRNGDNISGDKVLGDKVAGDKVYGDKKVYHLSDKDAARNQRIRAHLLEQLQATWIKGVLENSLYEVARLELGLESQPDAVERPWVMELERSNHPPKTLPPTSKILDTYRELGGSVLILGAPGSGKTITLLELARDLRQVALKDDSQPIPLVFNLASWAQKRQPLLDWLAEELFTIYGVGRKHAPKWLETADYHLLLDGLDEVAAPHRNACVQAINYFRQEYGPVNTVVCSRNKDYERLNIKLSLTNAISIKKLSSDQVKAYLNSASPHLVQLVENDEELKELAQAPLTLNIIAFTFRDQLPKQSPTGTPEQYRQHLFAAYIDRMFKHRVTSKVFNKTEAIQHLTFLAAQMQQQDLSLYYIEKMQPAWVGKYKHLFSVLNGILFGLLGLLLAGLLFGMKFGLFVGLIVGYLGGLNKITITETLNWSLKQGILRGLLLGFSGAVTGLGYFGNFGGLLFGMLLGIVGWLSATLIVGFIVGIHGSMRGKEVQMNSVPNHQGILILGWISILFSIMFGLCVGLIFYLSEGIDEALLVGAVSGLSYWILGGGQIVIKHFLLRWFLANRNLLPFRLVPFLDAMANLLLLRKVGGGYIFIHRMLLEHFADLAEE